jgi:hypothetical protein
MTTWRWDQGRLEYFMFDNMRAIAKSLNSLDGINISQKGVDPLRPVLTTDTGLPFSPNNYTVWRNYARVFGCSLLATRAGNNLIVTDLCKRIADDSIREPDEYLTSLVQNFRYPSPVFDSYSPKDDVVLPFMAILKFFAAAPLSEPFPKISVEEVFSKIIGNNCTGLEDIPRYSILRHTGNSPIGDQKRQVREMLVVLSQFSFLKWFDKHLYFDRSFNLDTFLQGLTPFIQKPQTDRLAEFLQLGSERSMTSTELITSTFELPLDLVFTEGKRLRVTHLKIERSPLLRKLFFAHYPNVQCNMCDLLPRQKYPWTDNILEIHHLLPLSSGVAVSLTGTSLEDIVSLCPNCHRSVHAYYKTWLDNQQANDFNSKQEAKAVYLEAKKAVA